MNLKVTLVDSSEHCIRFFLYFQGLLKKNKHHSRVSQKGNYSIEYSIRISNKRRGYVDMGTDKLNL
jgi:hypothetical protein